VANYITMVLQLLPNDIQLSICSFMSFQELLKGLLKIHLFSNRVDVVRSRLEVYIRCSKFKHVLPQILRDHNTQAMCKLNVAIECAEDFVCGRMKYPTDPNNEVMNTAHLLAMLYNVRRVSPRHQQIGIQTIVRISEEIGRFRFVSYMLQIDGHRYLEEYYTTTPYRLSNPTLNNDVLRILLMFYECNTLTPCMTNHFLNALKESLMVGCTAVVDVLEHIRNKEPQIPSWMTQPLAEVLWTRFAQTWSTEKERGFLLLMLKCKDAYIPTDAPLRGLCHIAFAPQWFDVSTQALIFILLSHYPPLAWSRCVVRTKYIERVVGRANLCVGTIHGAPTTTFTHFLKILYQISRTSSRLRQRRAKLQLLRISQHCVVCAAQITDFMFTQSDGNSNVMDSQHLFYPTSFFPCQVMSVPITRQRLTLMWYNTIHNAPELTTTIMRSWTHYTLNVITNPSTFTPAEQYIAALVYGMSVHTDLARKLEEGSTRVLGVMISMLNCNHPHISRQALCTAVQRLVCGQAQLIESARETFSIQSYISNDPKHSNAERRLSAFLDEPFNCRCFSDPMNLSSHEQ